MFSRIKFKYISQFQTKLKVGLRSKMSSIAQTTSSQVPKISICHMRATNDKEHNRRQVREIVQIAKKQSAQVYNKYNISF